MIWSWAGLFAAFAATYVLLLGMLRSGVARMALDMPNQRSLHTSPVPRTWGLGLMAGILIGWALLGGVWLVPFAVMGGALLAISLADDISGVAFGWRLLVHFVVAAVCVGMVFPSPVHVGWYVPLVLFVVWMINLYNFMDGADGLAGGMAFGGFGMYGMASWLGGDQELAFAVWTIALSSLAFLFFNFSPARIFLGDSGSVPLGFFAGAWGIWGWERGIWDFWFPLLVFSPFIMDASVTLAKRGLTGERIWQAHREHYYQRLIRMGWSHRSVALGEFGLMALAGVTGLFGLQMTRVGQLGILVVWGGVYLLLMRWVDIKWAAYLINSPR